MGSRNVTCHPMRWLAGIGIVGLVLGCSSSNSNQSNGGSSGSSGSNAGNNSNGSGANAGGSSGAVTLGDCVTADTQPCKTFAYPLEDGGTQTVQLGPYGAQADPNVGTGFENALQSTDQNGGAPSQGCQTFANLFAEPAAITGMLLQTMANGITIDFSLYSVYRPAIWPKDPVPVITWGNGTCAQPEGYGALLRYVASYGYFIVAANSRQVGSGSPPPMLHALDYAAAANMDQTSPYYQHLDMSKVGAMGHSQGGAATTSAASDPRILDIIVFNGLGASGSPPKPFLTISGDLDLTGATASSMAAQVNAAAKAAYLYYHNPVGTGMLRGHLVLMLTPERVEDQTVSWWEMLFRNDATATAKFVGSSCGFCGHSSDVMNAYEFGEHGLP